jgi:phosphoadenosine phosphosulfate reductase
MLTRLPSEEILVPDQGRAVLTERAQFDDRARELEAKSPQEVLRWALDAYRGRIVISSSFGGPTSMVALDMAMAIDRTVPVSYIDTGLLFPETYALIENVERRYGIEVHAVSSDISVGDQARMYGDALWSRDPDVCCGIRKVAPQQAYLAQFDAWITGLRRDQGGWRAHTPVIDWDERFGLVKLNPLATWDSKRVWAYIYERDLPYNALNDNGYPSVGCVHCTRAVGAGENQRAGRWSGFGKIECGLHLVSDGEGI